MAGAHAWGVWLLAVAFVVYLFSFQTGYAIVNHLRDEVIPPIARAAGFRVRLMKPGPAMCTRATSA